MSQDWRIETEATDYFQHRDKRLVTEERRPIIRKSSDLVGPGIGSGAVRITDYNDILATFNGYYSSVPGALYAPNPTDSFIGHVIMDTELGGRQTFTSLVSGNEYTRVFRRSPSDADSISYGAWLHAATSPAMAVGVPGRPGETLIDVDNTYWLRLPEMEFRGEGETFGPSATVLTMRRPGAYTGHVVVRLTDDTFFSSLKFEFPNGDKQVSDSLFNWWGAGGIPFPFTFYTTNSTGFIRITAVLGDLDDSSIPSTTAKVDRLSVIRVGDA
jgi:hypothetical protein